jgi:hypothetical protein
MFGASVHLKKMKMCRVMPFVCAKTWTYCQNWTNDPHDPNDQSIQLALAPLAPQFQSQYMPSIGCIAATFHFLEVILADKWILFSSFLHVLSW